MTPIQVDGPITRVGAWLLPRRCAFCGAAGGSMVCVPCADRLPWLDARATPAADHWAAFRYEEPVRAQIVGLKFRAHLASARLLESIGMQFEGRLRRWLMHPNVSAAPRDCLCYAIVKTAG